jgi:hypothetical protein
MTAPQVLSVTRAGHDMPCRRCGRTISRGRRAALVLGVGQVHLGCLLGHGDQNAQDDDQPDQRQETT